MWRPANWPCEARRGTTEACATLSRLALALAAAGLDFLLTVFLMGFLIDFEAVATGRFLSVVDLLCAQTGAGNSKLTGYSGGSGVSTKIQLLDIEGIEYK